MQRPDGTDPSHYDDWVRVMTHMKRHCLALLSSRDDAERRFEDWRIVDRDENDDFSNLHVTRTVHTLRLWMGYVNTAMFITITTEFGEQLFEVCYRILEDRTLRLLERHSCDDTSWGHPPGSYDAIAHVFRDEFQTDVDFGSHNEVYFSR